MNLPMTCAATLFTDCKKRMCDSNWLDAYSNMNSVVSALRLTNALMQNVAKALDNQQAGKSSRGCADT